MNIIPACCIDIGDIAKAFGIAAADIIDIILVLGRDFGAIPLGEAAADVNGIIFAGIHTGVRSLIAPDVIDHLHIIVVSMAALHGFGVPAGILVGAVDQRTGYCGL